MAVGKAVQDTKSEISTSNGNGDEIYSKLETRINRIAKNEGYVSHSVRRKIVSTGGNNYASILIEVDIEGKTKNGDKVTNLFIKYVLPGEAFENLIKLEDAFAKETLMYRKIAPVLLEIQEEAGVPHDDRYRIPKSYEGCDVDAVILENLAKCGLKTLHRMEVMPLKFAELSVIELAKFHGLSFVLEAKRPDFFESTIKSITPAFNFKKPWHLYAKKVREVAMLYLNSEEKTKVEAFIPTMLEKYPKYLSGETSSVKCLCYGDFRMNNILTRLVDGVPVEVMPVDYQLIYYGSPVVDLIYFIISASDKQFRKQHMTYLKDLYFSSLKKFLKYFNMNVDHVYPRKVFEKDFEESLDYGLMYVLMFLPLAFSSEVDVLDFGETSVIDTPFVLNDKFRERITGIFDDYTEWGIL